MPTSADRLAGRITNSEENKCFFGCLLLAELLGVGVIAISIWLIAAFCNSSERTYNNDSPIYVVFLFLLYMIFFLPLSLPSVVESLHSEQQRYLGAQNPEGAGAQQERETPEEQAQRNSLPTFEEAVGSGQ